MRKMRKYRKKIFIVTGNRSDYDLLFWLLKELKKNKIFFDYKLIVTGNHFSKKYGSTFKNIQKDGFSIFKTIRLNFKKDNTNNLILNIGKILISFNKILSKQKPDFIILLGDRYEILPIAVNSMFHKIPICHLNGGEHTSNSFDDYVRNCVTKLSYYHFPANNSYKKNIIQMGENPNRVFMKGGLSEDQVKNFNLIDKKKIQKKLNFVFNKKNALVTYHPETLDTKNNKKNLRILIDSLLSFKDINLFFSYPNSDPQSEIIIKELKKKRLGVDGSNRIYIFKTLGRSKYLSLMKYSDFVIGNSSSGILEAPLMNKVSINIGDRQKGRIKPKSVIDCKVESKKIINVIKSVLKKKIKFKRNSPQRKSPAKEIVKVLKSIHIPENIKKDFYNLN